MTPMKIPVYKYGKVVAYAIVDACDYERLSKHRWYLLNGYAVRYTTVDGKRRYIYMHREVLGLVHGDGIKCDHENRHNKLDNRRSNLRTCTTRQNNCNRGPLKGRYSGANFDKRKGKWRAHTRIHGTKYHLGYYDSEEKAASAVDMAKRILDSKDHDFHHYNEPGIELDGRDLATAERCIERARNRIERARNRIEAAQ